MENLNATNSLFRKTDIDIMQHESPSHHKVIKRNAGYHKCWKHVQIDESSLGTPSSDLLLTTGVPIHIEPPQTIVTVYPEDEYELRGLYSNFQPIRRDHLGAALTIRVHEPFKLV